MDEFLIEKFLDFLMNSSFENFLETVFRINSWNLEKLYIKNSSISERSRILRTQILFSRIFSGYGHLSPLPRIRIYNNRDNSDFGISTVSVLQGLSYPKNIQPKRFRLSGISYANCLFNQYIFIKVVERKKKRKIYDLSVYLDFE